MQNEPDAEKSSKGQRLILLFPFLGLYTSIHPENDNIVKTSIKKKKIKTLVLQRDNREIRGLAKD